MRIHAKNKEIKKWEPCNLVVISLCDIRNHVIPFWELYLNPFWQSGDKSFKTLKGNATLKSIVL